MSGCSLGARYRYVLAYLLLTTNLLTYVSARGSRYLHTGRKYCGVKVSPREDEEGLDTA